ncbi:hypothetical protein SAMN05421636_1019 [Pricia antarctica]|uniref:Uncharacterized protein n=1 Tax=Pricia antarctica TaxID=641691 RepID=A0A1G6VN65_9FLAO|nr:hypothetical protein SAMN05421636_1019 [Pricia antarctica]
MLREKDGKAKSDKTAPLKTRKEKKEAKIAKQNSKNKAI